MQDAREDAGRYNNKPHVGAAGIIEEIIVNFWLLLLTVLCFIGAFVVAVG